jgi:hypothetical protein
VGSGPGGFEVPPFDRHQIALLEEAAATAGGVLRVHVLARLSVALSLTADATRRVALSDEAIALARDVGDHSSLGYALASRCDVIAGPEHAEERLAAGREILACAREAGDSRLELLARRLRIVALLERGDIDDVDDELAAYEACAEPLGQVVYSWYMPLWRAMRAAMEGCLDTSERLRAEAASLGEIAHSENAAMLVPSQAAMLACELHDPKQAVGFFSGRPTGGPTTRSWPAPRSPTRSPSAATPPGRRPSSTASTSTTTNATRSDRNGCPCSSCSLTLSR